MNIGLTNFTYALEHLAADYPTSQLAERAESISSHYRQAAPSSGVIGSEADALAYALVRAPATFSAISAALDAALARLKKFEPQNILDIGAGPGTASWVAAELWPDAAFSMLDHNPQFLKLSQSLVRLSESAGLRNTTIRPGDMSTAFSDGGKYDLVFAGYALTELPDALFLDAVKHAWSLTSGMLVLVEPGRPRDYQRLMQARDWLIEAGGSVVSPCPHALTCPVQGDDWCHFSARLPRTRLHRSIKKADMGYEDEKYSYLALVRPEIGTSAVQSRIIAPPRPLKYGVRLPLCQPDGTRAEVEVTKRDPAYKTVRKLSWGDTV